MGWDPDMEQAPSRGSYHGTCATFTEPLPMDPWYICSNCGRPSWTHKEKDPSEEGSELPVATAD